MTPVFVKATRTESKLRMALTGPPGSGKTYTGLLFAQALGAGRIAVIDTERGSAKKYANTELAAGLGPVEFDVCELDSYHPENYIRAVEAAESAGYGVLLIDSLSHAWAGKEGVLEIVDKAKLNSQNQFSAWAVGTPLHNRLIDTILGAKLHVLTTLRSKMGYVLEEQVKGSRTIQVPVRVGYQPIQREGIEYEFDVVGDMDLENTIRFDKSRCPALKDQVFARPGPEVIDLVKAWLEGVSLEDLIEQDLQEIHALLEEEAVQAYPEKVAEAKAWLRDPKNQTRPRLAQFRKSLREFIEMEHALSSEKELSPAPAGKGDLFDA